MDNVLSHRLDITEKGFFLETVDNADLKIYKIVYLEWEVLALQPTLHVRNSTTLFL